MNQDGSFVAEFEAPEGFEHIRFGERLFAEVAAVSGVTVFEAVEVFPAPTEGALVVEP